MVRHWWQTRAAGWRWRIALVLLEDSDATVGGPVARYVCEYFPGRRKVVVIAEIDPPIGWTACCPVTAVMNSNENFVG